MFAFTPALQFFTYFLHDNHHYFQHTYLLPKMARKAFRVRPVPTMAPCTGRIHWLAVFETSAAATQHQRRQLELALSALETPSESLIADTRRPRLAIPVRRAVLALPDLPVRSVTAAACHRAIALHWRAEGDTTPPPYQRRVPAPASAPPPRPRGEGAVPVTGLLGGIGGGGVMNIWHAVKRPHSQLRPREFL